MASVWAELRRRNVVKVAVAYAIVGWLLVEVASVVFPTFKAPEWIMQVFTFLVIVGFPLALIFAWAYELTPEGLKKEKDVDRAESITHVTGRKLDYFIIAVLILALSYFAFDKFVLDPSRDAELVQATKEAVTEQATESGKAETADKSIVVLPFVNMSDDAGNEYFSDGISEELLNLLAKIPELRVISRSSAFSIKGKDLDIPTIAAQLNVANVLEGSVRKAGNRVRITAQLIDAQSDTHLWSATYDRTLDDIFAIQDEIAAEVVNALKITLLGEAIPKARETTPKAYALYLQGQHFSELSTPESFRKADDLLHQALAIDPGFVPAWDKLGTIYINQAITGLIGFDEGYRQARTFAHKALELDPDFARIHSMLGWIAMMYDRDLDTSAAYFRHARALAPTDAIVVRNIVIFALNLGRLEEAIELGKQSLTLNPLSPGVHGNLAMAYSYVGRLDEAEFALNTALDLSPNHDWALTKLARVHLLQGRPDAALAVAEKIGLQRRKLYVLPMAYYDLGQAEASVAALAALKEGYADDAAAFIAEVHAWRGEVDASFEWLDRTIDESQFIRWSMFFDPAFKNLHADPRWEVFRTKVGRSEELLKEIQF
ncbi:MAG: tetratricopeptide repeat protein [Gammaproteobacteria bacterium]